MLLYTEGFLYKFLMNNSEKKQVLNTPLKLHQSLYNIPHLLRKKRIVLQLNYCVKYEMFLRPTSHDSGEIREKSINSWSLFYILNN